MLLSYGLKSRHSLQDESDSCVSPQSCRNSSKPRWGHAYVYTSKYWVLQRRKVGRRWVLERFTTYTIRAIEFWEVGAQRCNKQLLSCAPTTVPVRFMCTPKNTSTAVCAALALVAFCEQLVLGVVPQARCTRKDKRAQQFYIGFCLFYAVFLRKGGAWYSFLAFG